MGKGRRKPELSQKTNTLYPLRAPLREGPCSGPGERQFLWDNGVTHSLVYSFTYSRTLAKRVIPSHHVPEVRRCSACVQVMEGV